IWTAAAWALSSLGLRTYLQVVSGGNQVFGALGGALIVLLWLYVLAIGMLLGGELNAVLAERHGRPPGDFEGKDTSAEAEHAEASAVECAPRDSNPEPMG